MPRIRKLRNFTQHKSIFSVLRSETNLINWGQQRQVKTTFLSGLTLYKGKRFLFFFHQFHIHTNMHFIFYLILLVSAADYGNFGTYPKVPKTASINGFADPIYDLLPDCAKECVKFSTSNTPCPYWDTGCFCVMPQWAGLVGQCVAQKCKGEDVASARFLATSVVFSCWC